MYDSPVSSPQSGYDDSQVVLYSTWSIIFIIGKYIDPAYAGWYHGNKVSCFLPGRADRKNTLKRWGKEDQISYLKHHSGFV